MGSSARKVQTEGRILLRRAIEMEQGKGVTQREIASECRISEQSFWAYKNGTRRPGEIHAAALEARLGVPCSSWRTPAEKKALAREKRALRRLKAA